MESVATTGVPGLKIEIWDTPEWRIRFENSGLGGGAGLFDEEIRDGDGAVCA